MTYTRTDQVSVVVVFDATRFMLHTSSYSEISSDFNSILVGGRRKDMLARDRGEESAGELKLTNRPGNSTFFWRAIKCKGKSRKVTAVTFLTGIWRSHNCWMGNKN